MIRTGTDAALRAPARRRSRARGRDRPPPRAPLGRPRRGHRGRQAVPARPGRRHARRAGRRRSPDAAAEVGAAVELLHTAFVIHDDVIDDDHVRRGRPNVSGTFRARAGATGADARTTAAGYGLHRRHPGRRPRPRGRASAPSHCAAPRADVVRRLLDLFDAALHTTAAGELADVRLTLDLAPATLAESLAMEAQKTSAYSFALPLQAGAVLAGADEATTGRLGEVGRAMGMAFQLVDDLIGVFGDPARSGKSATVRPAHPQADAAAGPRAVDLGVGRRSARYVGRELGDDELDEVRALLTASGLAALRRGARRGAPRPRPGRCSPGSGVSARPARRHDRPARRARRRREVAA